MIGFVRSAGAAARRDAVPTVRSLSLPGSSAPRLASPSAPSPFLAGVAAPHRAFAPLPPPTMIGLLRSAGAAARRDAVPTVRSLSLPGSSAPCLASPSAPSLGSLPPGSRRFISSPPEELSKNQQYLHNRLVSVKGSRADEANIIRNETAFMETQFTKFQKLCRGSDSQGKVAVRTAINNIVGLIGVGMLIGLLVASVIIAQDNQEAGASAKSEATKSDAEKATEAEKVAVSAAKESVDALMEVHELAREAKEAAAAVKADKGVRS